LLTLYIDSKTTEPFSIIVVILCIGGFKVGSHINFIPVLENQIFFWLYIRYMVAVGVIDSKIVIMIGYNFLCSMILLMWYRLIKLFYITVKLSDNYNYILEKKFIWLVKLI